MRVNLYRGYAADQRLSMDIYSQRLEELLKGSDAEAVQINPSSGRERSQARWLMRYLRYIEFPKQVQKESADIHHVVDHGYAHLHPHLGAGSTCITVHDLIPLLFHKGVIGGDSTRRRPWLNQYSLSYLDRYDAIVAISQSTANDLVEYLGIDRKKITVISPSIGQDFQPVDQAQLAQFAKRYALKSSPLWLLVSGREFYKNHAASLRVLRELRDRGYQAHMLKIGLPSDTFQQDARSLGVVDYVTEVLLEQVEELPLAYGFVDCLLFPSWYEGFGLPVAEALACGTPAVCSTQGSLPEIAPTLTEHVNPEDISALADAVIASVQRVREDDNFVTAAQHAVAPYRRQSLLPMWLNLYQRLAQ